MGLGDIIRGFFNRGKKTYPCPNCKEALLTLDMERCPKCGTRLEAMFVKRCPNCKEVNNLRAKRCKKCGFDFEVYELERSVWKCPICGYEMSSFMTQCPVCGTKFV